MENSVMEVTGLIQDGRSHWSLKSRNNQHTHEEVRVVQRAFSHSSIISQFALNFSCLMTYIYNIYMSYRTVNLQKFYFIYLLNKYTY